MSIEGHSQGHFFTIYFPGFVCFVLKEAKISGERLQDHWSSGLFFLMHRNMMHMERVEVDAHTMYIPLRIGNRI